MESVPDPIGCLLSCSDSPYDEVLAGPPTPSKRELAISQWEKVRPRAVYNLTMAASQESRRCKRQKFSYQALLRDVVSMPNLCTKDFDLSERQWSYMSGHLDEDFSYVYTGGLSERCTKANSEAEHKRWPHDSRGKSVSTCNLTLDPSTLFSNRQSIHVEPRTQYGEISKMFAMQLKPELLAQQLLIEKRLRNVDLNTRPDLQKEDARSGREKKDTESTNSTTLLAHAKSSHLQQTRKLRRQRQGRPKMWHPLPANEEPHQQFPIDLSFNTGRSQATRIPNSDVAVNCKARLYNQFGIGSNHAGITGREAQVKIPRRDKKSNKSDLKDKQRTVTYHIIFDHDKHTQGNNSPGQARAWRESQSQATIPVFVPSLEQEQAMIPKRFSKLTALQLKPSATSSVITDRLFYAE